jgi:hypothetical protein
MKTFTTKGYLDLPDEDEMRSNGCSDVVVLENESGTIQVQMNQDELEETGIEVDSEVVTDELMDKVLAALIEDGLLE